MKINGINNQGVEMISNLDNEYRTNKYAGGLVVTIFKKNTKQVKKEISGIPTLKEAVNVATI
jgi:hypothetical protein